MKTAKDVIKYLDIHIKQLEATKDITEYPDLKINRIKQGKLEALKQLREWIVK